MLTHQSRFMSFCDIRGLQHAGHVRASFSSVPVLNDRYQHSPLI